MSNGISKTDLNLIPAGYKQTEVGVIPEDWECSNLDYICSTIGDGIHSTPTYNNNGEYFFINGNNLIDGKITTFNETKKTDFVEFYKHKKNLNERTILLSINGTIGNIAFYRDEQIVLGKSVAYLNIKSTIDKYYIYYCLCSEKTLQTFYDGLTGSTIKNLGLGTIRTTNIPLPPKKEQTAIANALSDVDALISELENLIAKKQAIKTATMQQLLTGRTRLPQFALREDGSKKGNKQSELGEIPEDWEVDSIGNLISITTGSRNTQDRIEEGVYPFFVRSQTVERINTFSFDGEAVLTAGDGVGTGKIFHYINGKFDFHQRVYLMYNFGEIIDGYFFYIYFSNNFYDRIMSMTAKSSVDSVRREMIADMKMLLPTKKEQTAIATILSDMDEEIQALKQRLSKTRQIKQGMMQELLTGKTRLI
ncbi:TPA: restriction endonuclease subunit S [Proteus mirabilis]|uniref:restriction endonuclease subunit S n=1 Tax=Proteus mirabilis TaxID=584 RepID=UPI0034D55226